MIVKKNRVSTYKCTIFKLLLKRKKENRTIPTSLRNHNVLNNKTIRHLLGRGDNCLKLNYEDKFH